MPVLPVPDTFLRNLHSSILTAPYQLQLRVGRRLYDMITFDTREELEGVMSFVDIVKERTCERKEHERPANLEDLRTLSQFIISEFAKTQLPDLIQPPRDDMIPDSCVMIEHYDIQQTLLAPSTCLCWYGEI